MTNDEKHKENDTMELHQLISDVQDNEVEQDSPKHNLQETNKDDEREVDILNLPPRKTVHVQNKGKIKLKLNRSLIRFTLILIIVIGLLIVAWRLFGENVPGELNMKPNWFSKESLGEASIISFSDYQDQKL